ncbi:hypothetical protein [Niastella populi]|uniref:hypothetical protein n=1 Tax=Niastella populi TaxID=550983 RepID=UPI0010543202|nr:hypothetical protein [Niastella populi]
MQKAVKVQLLKNTPDAIFIQFLTILERNSINDFEKQYLPDCGYFGVGPAFSSLAHRTWKKALVSSAIQVIGIILGVVRIDECFAMDGFAGSHP